MESKRLWLSLVVIGFIILFFSVNILRSAASQDEIVEQTIESLRSEVIRLSEDFEKLKQQQKQQQHNELKQDTDLGEKIESLRSEILRLSEEMEQLEEQQQQQQQQLSSAKRKKCFEDGAPPLSVPQKWQDYYGLNTITPVGDSSLFALVQERFGGKRGFETGGPSGPFRTDVRVYDVAGSIDNSNFSNHTMWEGQLKDGSPFKYSDSKPAGIQYIRDATDLYGIPDESYDFAMAAHVLEHFANPFKAVSEWNRIIKPGGTLLLILPYSPNTFDHNRPAATLDHLIQHWKDKTPETDLSHLPEILQLHDLSMDPGAGSRQNFEQRGQKNAENRGLHQHVFNFKLLIEMFYCWGYDVVGVNLMSPFHQIVIGQKMT